MQGTKAPNNAPTQSGGTELSRLRVTTDTNATAAKVMGERAKISVGIFIRGREAEERKIRYHDYRIVQAGIRIIQQQQKFRGKEYEDVICEAFAINTKLLDAKNSVDHLDSLAAGQRPVESRETAIAWCDAFLAVNYTANAALEFFEKYSGVKGGVRTYSKDLYDELETVVGWTRAERGRLLRMCGEGAVYEDALFSIFLNAVNFESAKEKVKLAGSIEPKDRSVNKDTLVDSWVVVRDSADAAAAFVKQNSDVQIYSKELFDGLEAAANWLRKMEELLSHVVDVTKWPVSTPSSYAERAEAMASYRRKEVFNRWLLNKAEEFRRRQEYIHSAGRH